MYIVFELLLIMSYMINDFFGFFTSIIVFSLVIVNDKKNLYNCFVDLLILSLPLYSLSVIGDKINHAFSWILIMLFFLSIYNVVTIIKEKIKIEKKVFLSFFLGIVLLIIGNIRFNVIYEFIEIGQVLMMVIPILTTYLCKDLIVQKINKKEFDGYITKVEDVIFATAICTIIQCVLYYTLNLSLGVVTIFPNRVIFDLFFKAYSVLSLFISIGIVIAILKIIYSFKEKKIEYSQIIKFLIFIVAIVMNSSRTGIISAIITIFIVINSKTMNIDKNKKRILNLIVIVLALLVICLIMLTRKDMNSFFSDNERTGTYIYGFELITRSPMNFLFGNGLSPKNYNHIMPHNFILETFTTSGIFVTIMVFLYLTKLLLYIKNTNYRFTIYCILIGSMFITCFYGNPFTTVLVVLAILDEKMKEVKE